MRRFLVIVMTVAVVLVSGSGTAFAKKFPKNACKLATAAQVQAVVADADAGAPQHQAVGPVKESSCYYKETNQSVSALDTLTISVTTLPAGIPFSELKLSLKEEGATQVKGLGRVAYVSSAVPIDVEVKAVVGKVLLTVELNDGSNANDRRDALITLAKQVAKKL